MKRFQYTILFFYALLILTMISGFVMQGCKQEPPPPPPPVPAAPVLKPLILVDSGLGGPALGDVAAMLRREFPDAHTVDFGTGPNAYLANLNAYLADNPHSFVIIVAHSWGVSNVFNEADQLGDVRAFVAIDGCRHPKHRPFVVTPNIKSCMVITGDFSGLIRANVDGPHLHVMIHGGHSSMTKTPELMALVRWAVADAMGRGK